jgi:sec-independent protein translocase protein TatB
MFDVGFFELLLIGVVALLVVGPERLPKIARTAGLWLGKGRRFITSVKADIEQELKADELKRILEEQKRANPLHEIIEDTKHSFEDIKKQTESAVRPDTKPPAKSAGSAPADPAKSHDGPDKS